MRFPEFSDEWKQTTLGEVCTIKTGKLDANAMVEGGPYPFFTCAKQTYQTDTYSFSGEAILVAGNGEVGLTKYYNGKFNAYQRTYVLQSVRGDIILLFIRNYIDYTLPKRIISLLNGSAMPYITLSTLSDMPLPLPSLPEQKKIATFLSLIDERIEAQRQTIKERKNQKKALLHQLFSQSLRFPGFSDEWQQTTLGRICKVSTGEMNTQDKVEGGKYPFYVRSSKIERANRYTYDGISILTPGDGAIGQIFHYSEGKIAVHQRVYMLTEMQCIPKYLFHYFSVRFLERVSRMSAKNTVDSVRMNMITDMPISLPSLAEQRKIAELLAIFDERIEAEEALLKCYEAQKRYLLRQMFV